jgi:hypothetical protein
VEDDEDNESQKECKQRHQSTEQCELISGFKEKSGGGFAADTIQKTPRQSHGADHYNRVSYQHFSTAMGDIVHACSNGDMDGSVA